ncbi:MAG: SRPBCC family protein [Gordonia sp. (in: high G+C Gram-positive bacteria)]
MNRRHLRTVAVALAVGATAAAIAYRFRLREDVLDWGATEEEVNATLPGDEFLPDADGVSTRAITIAAPPEAVYPWIVQMGPAPRGGAYTYDWIENLLGLNFHSVDDVLPQFQHPELGERVEFGPNVMEVVRIDPDRAFVIATLDGDWVWSFNIVDSPFGTRLISRNRYRYTLGQAPMMELMIPGSLVMERKMLLGVRHRAERLATVSAR